MNQELLDIAFVIYKECRYFTVDVLFVFNKPMINYK